MIEEQQQIIVVTGVQGAGKSTIGRKLAESFKRGVFIEADALQRMIVSGGVWATDEGGPGVVVGEPARQLRLRLKNACLLARSFVEAGFTAVIDDIIIGLRWDQLRSGLAGVPFRFVVLAPDVPTVEARDAARESHTIGGGWAVSLPRFSGHLDCGEILAQRGVQDGHTIPGRVPRAGGGVSAAA